MGDRARWIAVLAPVALTVLIAAVVGGFVVVQNQRQADRVEQADAVAADYLSQVAAFRSDVQEALADADPEDPAAILAALTDAVADPPELADTDAVGRAGSTAYVEAEEVEADLLAPYESLREELESAEVATTWIAAADEALALRVTDYLDTTTLSSSAPLRSSLIPAFVRARDELAAVPVPPGQQEVAATVRAALQHVIDEASILASRIEANQTYSFTYAAEFETAITAVNDYATGVEGDLTEQLNAVADLT